jgi:hypothetical protein
LACLIFEIPSFQILSEPKLTEDNAHDKSLKETVSGYVINVINREGTARIFVLETSAGQKFCCFGRVIPSKDFFGGDRLKIEGIRKDDPHHPEYGKSFFYSIYERIRKETPEVNIAGKKKQPDR